MQELKDNDKNVEMARKCLALIRDIADRGASSSDPDDVGYALQELSQVLLERTGVQDRIFEPVPAGELRGLSALYEELGFVDASSQDFDTMHGPVRPGQRGGVQTDLVEFNANRNQNWS